MVWKRFFGGAPRDDAPFALYGAGVRQARSPVFYLEGKVADTVEGRFELVALHTYLLIRRLRLAGAPGKETGQKLFDILFDDMDQTLREMGVGDLSVGKKIKALASSFYGRMQAYDKGLAEEGSELALALARNVYGAEAVDARSLALADYVRRADAALEAQSADEIIAGRVTFDAPFAPELGKAG